VHEDSGSRRRQGGEIVVKVIENCLRELDRRPHRLASSRHLLWRSHNSRTARGGFGVTARMRIRNLALFEDIVADTTNLNISVGTLRLGCTGARDQRNDVEHNELVLIIVVKAFPVLDGSDAEL
jgi:hypothetical protein